MTNPVSVAITLNTATIAQQGVVPFDQDPNTPGDQISPEQKAVNEKLSQPFPADKFETITPKNGQRPFNVPGAARVWQGQANKNLQQPAEQKIPVWLEGTIEYTEDNPKSAHYGEIVTQGPNGKTYKDPNLVPKPIEPGDNLGDGVNRNGGNAPVYKGTKPDKQ